ncbi:MAG: prepilin peptidase [Planctomycetota bacterium]|jgi:leader peptidase (prepilin peptidase)/N-methyltransferase
MEALLQGQAGLVLSFVIGASIGSFANVIIHRSPREGLSSMRPLRSFCPSCRVQLSWADNLPIVSWLLLRGRCRACRAPIGLRYPVVELLIALLFAAAFWMHPPAGRDGVVQLLVVWYLIATCVVVAFIDIEHTIIPDTITWPGMMLGLGVSLAVPTLQAGHVGFRPDAPHASALTASLFGMAAGGGSLYLVGRIGNLFLRRKMEAAGIQDAMGWGDVKWMALAGAFLGLTQVLSAILIGCFAGALIGLALIVVSRLRRHEAPTGLPFGPFLSIGILTELASPGLAWSLMDQITAAA